MGARRTDIHCRNRPQSPTLRTVVPNSAEVDAALRSLWIPWGIGGDGVTNLPGASYLRIAWDTSMPS